MVQAQFRFGGKDIPTTQPAGLTLLQMARSAGLNAPASCGAGSCAACMTRVVEGTVVTWDDDVLSNEERSEGWVLACQAVPSSHSVSVVYE